MKTTRRQELRTNELSHQIEQISNYLKDHAAVLTAAVVGAVVIIGGIFWYYNHQTSRSSKAWAQLMPTSPDEESSTSMLIERYKSVAQEQVSPEITRAAWLKVGNAALSELIPVNKESDAETENTVDDDKPDRDTLMETAKDAFQEVIRMGDDDLTAYGRSLVALGILEENKRQFDEARKWYQKLVDDDRLENTPFKMEARFRLEGMVGWSEPVEFPPPPPPAEPTPVANKVELTPVKESEVPLEAFSNVLSDLPRNKKPQDPPPAEPIPTTQPAESSEPSPQPQP